jgi:hypothetical protein
MANLRRRRRWRRAVLASVWPAAAVVVTVAGLVTVHVGNGSAGFEWGTWTGTDSIQVDEFVVRQGAAVGWFVTVVGQLGLASWGGSFVALRIRDRQEAQEPTLVIFSLSVHSELAIEALAEFKAVERPGWEPTDHHYDISHANFEESRWDARADQLEKVVRYGIDKIAGSGVDADLLRGPGVSVRAFFTFGPGAETLTPEIVEQLAHYNATIWIDATS